MSNQATAVKTGRAAVVLEPKGSLKFEDKQRKPLQPHEVAIKVQACGVCHSDSFAFYGAFPGIKYPIVPGHEIVGLVEEIGANVKTLKKGDRVGVGWHGGHCSTCVSCKQGDFITCDQLQVPGITVDGGYEEYAMFPEVVCAPVPDELTSSEAAPLLCAGITTYNALRHSGATAGDTVAILGIGGLGHLAIQFANKMGFRTVGIARGNDKADFARKLGAHEYINSEDNKAVETLNKMGGAKVVLSTVTSSAAMAPWVDALGVNGKLVLVGADVEPMQVNPISLLMKRRSITGWPSGTASDSIDCLKFAALTGVRPMIQAYPFDKAEEAYNRMMSGKARFRVVIEF